MDATPTTTPPSFPGSFEFRDAKLIPLDQSLIPAGDSPEVELRRMGYAETAIFGDGNLDIWETTDATLKYQFVCFLGFLQRWWEVGCADLPTLLEFGRYAAPMIQLCSAEELKFEVQQLKHCIEIAQQGKEPRR